MLYAALPYSPDFNSMYNMLKKVLAGDETKHINNFISTLTDNPAVTKKHLDDNKEYITLTHNDDYDDTLLFFNQCMLFGGLHDFRKYMFYGYVNTINQYPKCGIILSDSLLQETYEYIVNSKTKYKTKAKVVVERTWSCLLNIEKNNDLNMLYIYLFLAMFILDGNNIDYKRILTVPLRNHIHSLAYLSWYNKFMLTSTTINVIIERVLKDINDDNIFQHGIVALIIACIQAEHIANFKRLTYVTPLTKNIVNICFKYLQKTK